MEQGQLLALTTLEVWRWMQIMLSTSPIFLPTAYERLPLEAWSPHLQAADPRRTLMELEQQLVETRQG